MRSRVADEVREARRAEEEAVGVDARVRLAFELGARDLRLYAEANGVSCAEAKRALRRARQVGRPRSCANEP